MAFPGKLDLALIEHMRSESVVVLSPHFDDACFSVGALLNRIGCGVLINVFNRSLYLPNPATDAEQPLNEETVSKVRGAEDQQFASLCGLTRIQLNFAEPGFHGRSNDDCRQVDLDISMAQDALMSKLRTIVTDEGRRPYLLAPMAIGTHVNHHAVHQIVRRNSDELSKLFRLCFYEDQPYARNPKERYRAVQRFRAEWAQSTYKRNVLAIKWPEKRRLVEIYASQFRRAPGALKFRPASWLPLAVHEAIWLSEPDLA